ncbi:hypothetical protein HGM15179_008952 [Zosterops borbonicus]|uniref:Uncharacterized protein n=1 Tax=Zosterops borbonicus TaxID=364589 RepID=A0A8K1GG21_9PASS|nr:hypothetical protein HGM15179_008952 [Zosterops borbonicus]
MGTAQRLPELQEGLDNNPKDAQDGIVGVSVQSQGLDWMIPVDSSQLRIFWDSRNDSGAGLCHVCPQPLTFLRILCLQRKPGGE